MIRPLILTLTFAAASISALPTIATAATPISASAPSPRAQQLVERTIAANPDMLDIIVHVTPSRTSTNIVVAAHLTHALGEASGDDDIGVMRTGMPIVEVQKDGMRIGVLVQLHDSTGHPIGAVGMMYPYHAGDNQDAILRRSQQLRDRMARSIPSRAALFSS